MSVFILRLICCFILFIDISLALNFSKKKQINFIMSQIYDNNTFVSELTNAALANISVSNEKELNVMLKSREKRKAIKILTKIKNHTKNILKEMHEDKLAWVYEQFSKHKSLGKYFFTLKIMEYTFPLDIVTYFLKFNKVSAVQVVSKIEETYLGMINFVSHESYYEQWAQEINEIRNDYINTSHIITPPIIKAYTAQFCLTKIRSFLLNLSTEEQEKFIAILITVNSFT